MEAGDPLASVYLFCLVVGGGFFLITSLVSGGHQDHHADIGGLGEGIGHFLDAHGLHIGDEGHHESYGAINPLSLRNVLAFMAVFGLVGSFATYAGRSPSQALLFSILAGLLGMALSWGMLVFMVTRQATSQASESDFFGKAARVSVGIPGSLILGEVSLVVAGQRMSMPARSQSGKTLPSGQDVVIVGYEKGGVVVVTELELDPWKDLMPPDPKQ